MLQWVTEKVVEDHAVASEAPRNYMRDVSLEYHLTFWFLPARLCYDTIAYLAVQMVADGDRGKLSALSFNDLSGAKEKAAFRDITKNVLRIVKEAKHTFVELKTIRDSLVHFVGRPGNEVEAPKRININFSNVEGVKFTVQASRFADEYGSVDKWPVRQTLRKHFRLLYEIAGRLECCFLDHTAMEKLPGAYRFMRRSMFDFLDVANVEDFSHPKWAKSDIDAQ
ncbi:MAG: hypothetical protein WD847_18600 [Pirellulales bacterium]